MIITGDDSEGISALKSQLQQHFAMTDLGLLGYFLGIEVASSPKEYLLCQSKYAADKLTDSRTVETPLELNVHNSATDGYSLSDPTLY